MKRELEEVRAWARNQIQSGAVPQDSWSQHVALIEAVESVLQDMAVRTASTQSRRTGLRLVGADQERPLTEMSLGMTQPVRYQRRRHNLH